MSRAVANGHVAIAQWLHDVKDERCSAESVDQAARNGHLDMLQWLDENRLLTCTSDTMEGAAGNGHLDVVKWLHENHHECCSSLAIGTAARNCHLELVEWFYVNVHGKCQTTLALDSTCVTDAAAAGRLDMLRWMHEHYPWAFTRFAMDAAAANGRMDVITWLHEHRREGCSELAPYNAARNGHLGVLKWIYKHYPSSFGPELPDIMDGAAGEGHFEVVQWLHETRPELPATNAMYVAAIKGHLNVFLYLLEHRPEGFSLSSYEVDEAQDFRVLCHFDPDVRRNRRSNGATDEELCMLQTVYKQRPDFLRDCLRCLAKIACSVGNIAILDWVNQFGIELRSAAPIRDAVSRGDVKLLQWFFENKFEVTDPTLLELAVQGSQLEVVRWLSTHGYTVTSLALTRIAGEEMYSRYTGTPVLRWLVENGPPLDLPTATALVLEYRHIEIAWWATEDIRKHLVLQALETDDRRVVWWILARTQIEDKGSQQNIREAIQCCQGSTKPWFEENMRDVEGCSWYFSTSIKRQAVESEGAPLSRLKRRRSLA